MALRPQATALRQPTLLRQPMALLEDMPVELTVALLARRIALRPMALLLRPMAVISLTPLGRDRRPMTWRGPATETPRLNGMPPPARTDAATCASRTPTRCAVMGTKRRARPPKNERRSPLILSPAPLRGFFFVPRARQGHRLDLRERISRPASLAPIIRESRRLAM